LVCESPKRKKQQHASEWARYSSEAEQKNTLPNTSAHFSAFINSSLQRAFPKKKRTKGKREETKKENVRTTLCVMEMFKMHKLHCFCRLRQQIK